MARYYVYTWDMDLQRFTPQSGVRCGPYSLWGLRRALRRLQSMGYDCGRQDAWVLVTNEAPTVLQAEQQRRAAALARRRSRNDEFRKRISQETPLGLFSDTQGEESGK